MTKQELISYVSEYTGTTKVQSRSAVEGFISAIRKELIDNGKDIMIPDIGKLKVVTRKARVGRNPRSGEVLDVPEHKTVIFKPCKLIKDLLNNE